MGNLRIFVSNVNRSESALWPLYDLKLYFSTLFLGLGIRSSNCNARPITHTNNGRFPKAAQPQVAPENKLFASDARTSVTFLLEARCRALTGSRA